MLANQLEELEFEKGGAPRQIRARRNSVGVPAAGNDPTVGAFPQLVASSGVCRQAGISFSYKKRAACRENSSKSSAGGHWFRRMSGYERSYCKYSEPEASSRLSLHVFSQFFHTFLPLCAASLWTIPRWRPRQKQPKSAKNIPKTVVKPPKSSLGAPLRIPCGGEHANADGCNADTSQNNGASVSQSPQSVTPPSAATVEMMARIRARLARRFQVPIATGPAR